MAAAIPKEIEKTQAEKYVDNTKPPVENFQKFIYELFEKNGILNDLRAYLRGHIVNVLKTAKTGDTLQCQKLLTQRSQLNYQALNILIVEHLMRLEFSYSLSVFLSEIPLADMVFSFAKTLMEKCNNDIADLRFTDNDILLILNYLGLQCDPTQIFQLVELYKSDVTQSLLLCMLKWLPHQRPIKLEEVSSKESLPSSKSSKTFANSSHALLENTCVHLLHCTTCQTRMSRYKDGYKQKKKYLYKHMKAIVKPLNSADLMKNVEVLERSLIEEMFQELNTVYEAEIKMVTQEKNRLQQSMTDEIQKQRDELEQSFKAREEELEAYITHKKKFLWGLARSLRDQHVHLQNAMVEVRAETDRLYAKEASLKGQLEEAELILKKRGEDMRTQISEELAILDSHLTSMKKEREAINRERGELENLKNIENVTNDLDKNKTMPCEELHVHYDLLKNELSILKKFLETSKFSPKCVIERGTLTETDDLNTNPGLNNCQTAEKSKNNDDDKLKDQVVNDFRKKNVNFSPSKLDELHYEQIYRSNQSSESSEAVDSTVQCEQRDKLALQRLRNENHRLKNYAKQQKYHIEALSRACARATSQPHSGPAPLTPQPRSGPAPATHPPRTHHAQPAAPPPPPRRPTTNIPQNANTAPASNIQPAMNVGWRKGAGEEISMFRDAHPRILVPGDEIPFVGVLRDRERHTTRRQLLSQWRAMKSRNGPQMRINRRSPSPITNITAAQPSSAGPPEATASGPLTACLLRIDNVLMEQRGKSNHSRSSLKSFREKSPKSFLKEAKMKLRNIKDKSVAACEKSPSEVLREAKMRLRKLEIEAEAVEKSYLDYRRKQSELKSEKNVRPSRDSVKSHPFDVRVVDMNVTHSQEKVEDPFTLSRTHQSTTLSEYGRNLRSDIDKYLREYHADTTIKGLQLEYQNAVNITQPISNNFKSEVTEESLKDFLETPLTEFRKLYHSDRTVTNDNEEISGKNLMRNVSEQETPQAEGSRSAGSTRDHQKEDIDNKAKEILQHDTQRLNRNNEVAESRELATTITVDEHAIRVEVESGEEVKTEFQDISLVVQNTVHIKEIISQNSCAESDAPFTIFVTPRNSNEKIGESIGLDVPCFEPIIRSSSPEQEAHLTRNDVLDAIFQGDSHDGKPRRIERDGTKDNSLEDSLNGEDDFADNLTADVDNYNSRSASVNTPISLLKTSEDEIFWDN